MKDDPKEGLSDTPPDPSDLSPGDPLPLDVIASELRRQSEMRWQDRDGPKVPSGFAPPQGKVDADSEPPLISAQDMKELIDEGSDTAGPRKSSDVLTERLVQVRQRAETVERQRSATMAHNRELRQQLNGLRESMESRFEDLTQKVPVGDSNEADALRQELERVRSHATTELDTLRKKLAEASQANDSSRNVEFEAELQALRQEAAVLRHAVKEKDRVLEDLASQCRTLEDLVEDRDRAMEQLYRDLEQKNDDTGRDSLPDYGQLNRRPDTDDQPEPQGQREKEDTDLLGGSSLIYLPGENGGRKALVLAGLGGLILGILALEAATLATGRGELFGYLLGGSAPTVASMPSPPAPLAAASVRDAPATPARPPGPAPTAAPEPTRAAPASTASAPPRQAQPRIVRDRLRDGSAAPEMVALPGGEFTMGERQAGLGAGNSPAHPVQVPPLLISRTEVSFGEYDRFARASGRSLPADQNWGRGRQPVVNVNWDDAVAYTRWLSQQTGRTYRLPSEAEWEYAARGGSDDWHWWGYALGQGNAVCLDCGSDWDARQPAPVGSLAANPFGLYDTAGNVMEWVQDCYNPNYQGAPADGSAWLTGDCEQRVVRGGAYNKPSANLRSSARSKLPGELRLQMLGFRVVREP